MMTVMRGAVCNSAGGHLTFNAKSFSILPIVFAKQFRVGSQACPYARSQIMEEHNR